eukprot:SAG22_NODE_152_length_17377_cov_191.856928_22_plen_102_part_00
MPDWESAGALWVDAAEMVATLDADRGDYRAPDPERFFPAVASGALAPCPLGSPAWARFEDVVRTLTADASGGGGGGGGGAKVLAEAWAGLQAAYPRSLFER